MGSYGSRYSLIAHRTTAARHQLVIRIGCPGAVLSMVRLDAIHDNTQVRRLASMATDRFSTHARLPMVRTRRLDGLTVMLSTPVTRAV
jgi:hypothetical protein